MPRNPTTPPQWHTQLRNLAIRENPDAALARCCQPARDTLTRYALFSHLKSRRFRRCATSRLFNT